MEDDMFFVEPVTPATFFSADDKPIVKFTHLGAVQLYPERPLGPDMPPEHVPMRMNTWYPHKPISMRLNFSWFLEREFGNWFAFVRSHKYRFQCCDASKNDSATVALSWEDDFLRIYPAMLHEYNASVERDLSTPHHCHNGGCNTPSCVKSCLAHPGVSDINWNTCPAIDDINWPKAWVEVRHLLTVHMDAYQASTATASVVGSSGSTTID